MMQTLHRTAALAFAAAVAMAAPVAATTVVSGFDANTLARNDDSFTGPVAIGFDFNFFGSTYTQLWVNNNGNVTFNSGLSTFTPFGLTGAVTQPIIAPFFADVDTRGVGSAEVTYGTGTFGGQAAFGVNWVDVGYFNRGVDKLNSFQLLIVDRSDIAAGDADIIFNYGQILWETGGASGGTNGLGGNSARAGFSNGTGLAGTFFELPGSGVNGALLDAGAQALINRSNVDEDGRFVFTVRGGVVDPDPEVIPTPAALALFGFALAGFAALRRRV